MSRRLDVRPPSNGGGGSVTSPDGTINVTDGSEIDVHGMEYNAPDVFFGNDTATIGWFSDTPGGGFVITTPNGAIEFFAGNGSPVGNVTPSVLGVSFYQDVVTGNIWAAIANSDDTTWVQVGAGGGGGVASLSGAGVTESPGILNQNGGLSVIDTEGDGVQLQGNSEASLSINAPGNITVAGVSEGGGPAAISIASLNGFSDSSLLGNSIGLPLTIAEGVNDTFVYTPVSTGTPDTFTIPPGTYTSATAVVNAVNSATDSDDNELGDLGITAAWTGDGLWFTNNNAPGDTFSTGPTDALVSLGFTSGSPYTFIEKGSDTLGFFGATPIDQPTAIEEPTGGATVDAEARAAIVALINLLSGGAGGFGLTK